MGIEFPMGVGDIEMDDRCKYGGSCSLVESVGVER